MKIKSIVKVMNFHSLLRVDSSKKKAEKYFGYEQSVRDFIDNILNNKNLILDKKMVEMNKKENELNIFIANDLGFCGNFNSNIKEVLKKDTESDKIIIGKKIEQNNKYSNIILSVSKDEYFENSEKITKYIFDSIKYQRYRSINLIYNHYYNLTRIERVKEQILPLEKNDKEKKYNEDFAIEGNINSILINIITLYVSYEIKVAVENSYASENIMRQMVTSESLKKIDELEEEKRRDENKQKKMKNFKKQLDNINKLNLNTKK